MELKDQVCSRESGNRLEELGVKQNSHFYWTHCWNARLNRYDKEWIVDDKHYGTDDHKFKISAFTVAELGELLPKEIKIGNDIYERYEICNYKFGASDNSWGFSYRKSLHFGRWMEWLYSTCEINEAEARAKMLIYLLENNLIELNGG